jgi:hypothetical protein
MVTATNRKKKSLLLALMIITTSIITSGCESESVYHCLITAKEGTSVLTMEANVKATTAEEAEDRVRGKLDGFKNLSVECAGKRKRKVRVVK